MWWPGGAETRPVIPGEKRTRKRGRTPGPRGTTKKGAKRRKVVGIDTQIIESAESPKESSTKPGVSSGSLSVDLQREGLRGEGGNDDTWGGERSS